jgi:hypothetical protein
MKLFDYFYQYDFGHEWYLNVGCTKWFNLFQFECQWSLYYNRPILLFNILGESLVGFSITLGKFDFSFDFLAYRPRNLEWYGQ